MKRKKSASRGVFKTVAILLLLLMVFALVFRFLRRSDEVIPDLSFENGENILFDPDAI